jgi:CHAT domain-containing protein/predicted negative regulator of RcsB-dependent stress response
MFRYRYYVLYLVVLFCVLPLILLAQSAGDDLLQQAQAAYTAGDMTTATTLFQEARQAYEDESNRAGVADAFMGEGNILLEAADYINARSRYSNALLIYRNELADGSKAAQAARGVAHTYTVQGNTGSDAETYLREAMIQASSAGDLHEEGVTALELGDLFIARDDPNAAINFYNMANSKFFQNNDLDNQATSYMRLGDAHFGTWQMEFAINSYSQASTVYSQSLNQLENDVQAIHRIADVQQHRGDLRAALELYNQVLPVYASFSNLRGQGLVLAEQANIYRQLGYDAVLPQLQQSLGFLQQVGDDIGRAKVLNYMGEYYLREGEYQQALNQFQQALNIALQFDDPTQEGHAQHGIARVYDLGTNLGNYRDALNNFGFAQVRFRDTLHDPYTQQHILLSQAWFHQRREEYSQSDPLFFEALNVARGAGDRRGEAKATLQLAIAYEERRDLTQTVNYYLDALPIVTEIGDRILEGEIYLALGRLDVLAADFTTASERFGLALSAFRSGDDATYTAIALQELGRVQSNENNYAVALISFNEAIQTLDSITTLLRNNALIDETRGLILQGQGEAYLALGLYEQALQQLQAAQDIHRQLSDEYNMAFTWALLGTVYLEQNQLRQANDVFQQTIALSQRLENARAEAYSTIGMMRVHGLDETRPVREIGLAYDAALAACRRVGDSRCVQLTHLYRGDVELALGDFDESITFYASSLNEAKLALDSRGESRAHMRLGNVYRVSGDFFGAVQEWETAANLSNVLVDPMQEGEALQELGDIHLTRSQYNTALDYYNRRLIVYQSAELRIEEGLAYIAIGYAYQQQGQFSLALDYYNLAIEAAEDPSYQPQLQVSTLRDASLGIIYRHRGDLFRELGQFTPAEEDLTRAERFQIVSGDNYQLGYTLVAYGELDLARSNYQSALDRFFNALRTATEYKDALLESLSKYGLAQVYTADTDPTNTFEEEQNYQQALGLARTTAANPVLARNILRSLAHSWVRRSNLAQAEIYIQTARNEAKEALDFAGEAYALIDLGDLRLLQIRYREALQHYNEALPLFGRSEDWVGEGEVMQRIGDLLVLQVNYTDALTQYQQMVLHYNENNDVIRRALTLSLMGDVYREQTLYAIALQYQLDAMDTMREVDTTTEPTAQLLFESTQARIKRNLAMVQIALGQYNPARINLTEALDFTLRIGNRLEEGIISQLLGNLDTLAADYLAAIGRYEQAEEIYRSFSDSTRLGELYLDMGDAYYQLGIQNDSAWFSNGTAANLAYQSAWREATTNTGQANLLIEIQALHRLGRVRTRLGDIVSARENFVTAREKASASDNDIVLIAVLIDFAVLEEREGNTSNAITLYGEAIGHIENVHRGIREEGGQIAFIAQNILPYHRMVDILIQQGRDEEAFTYAERGRSRTFLFHLNNEQIDFGENADGELVAEFLTTLSEVSELRATKAELFALPIAADDTEQLANVNAEIENIHQRITLLEQNLESLEQRISAQSIVLSQFTQVSTVDLTTLRNSLTEDTLMLSYYVVPASAINDGQIYVFMIGRNIYDVRPLNVTTRNIENFIVDTAYLTQADAFSNLYQALIQPIEVQITEQNPSQLVIMPHGLLNYVPFGALATDGTTVLNERYTLRYIQSATVFIALGEKSEPTANPTALVLGNPVSELGDLPSAEQEARDVATLLGTQANIRLDATEKLIREQANFVDIIHIAAHGEFRAGNPLSTNLSLSQDATYTYDGALEVREIYSLSMHQRSPLVVLSACNTVTGVLAEGDEFQGLTRAFLLSGARGVVASLWQVDDAATAALMVRFYNNRKAGMSDAAALQEAQNYIRQQPGWGNPRYWAAFIIVG